MEKVKSFSQMFGIHPIVAFSLFIIDWMLFGAELMTLGTDWIITAPIGIVLGIAAMFVQRYGFKDELGVAIGKGLLLGLLTAIPTALPSLAMIPFAAIGAVKLLSNKTIDISNSTTGKELPSVNLQ
ncbi:MAG: hypothetical protein FD167_2590 [bacterium]|nr:MAG: hypothetical protein FD167_2590 [bacterium]